MVRYGTHLLWLCLAFAALSCAGDGTIVHLHLCPGSPQGSPEYEMLRRVTSWTVQVLGIEGDDVTWRRVFPGTGAIATIEIEGAIPPEHEVRLLVEGVGLDNASRSRVVAMAAGGPFFLRGNETVCLCIAPPETYVDDCASWQCVFDTPTGTCQSPY